MATIKGIWIFNKNPETALTQEAVNFTSNGVSFTSMRCAYGYNSYELYYNSTPAFAMSAWNSAYTEVDFGDTEQTVSDAFLSFMTTYAEQQTGVINITATSTKGVLLHTAGKYSAQDILVTPNLQTKTAMSNGEVTPDDGYAGLSKVVANVMPIYQEKTVTPSTSAFRVTYDSGYNALSGVVVNAIPSNYQQIIYQEKTVTPTATAQRVTFDSGYNALSGVVINGLDTWDGSYTDLALSSAMPFTINLSGASTVGNCTLTFEYGETTQACTLTEVNANYVFVPASFSGETSAETITLTVGSSYIYRLKYTTDGTDPKTSTTAVVLVDQTPDTLTFEIPVASVINIYAQFED